MTRRTERVNELVREEISDLLQREIKDPRFTGLVSVTDVHVSPDLRHARVFVSIMGSEEERKETFSALTAASHFIRKELGKRMTTRHTPELDFRLDDSLERGAHLADLMRQIHQGESTDRAPGASADDRDAPPA